MANRKRTTQSQRVTMKDVARHAGVSQPTVSFVLNDRRDVSIAAETRTRVLEAAKELNFQPNRAAQSLRSNRSYTVGVIADRLVSQPYAGHIVLGVQQAVQEAGYVCFVVETAQTTDGGKAAVENLVQQGVAGLIYAAPGPEYVTPVDGLDTVPTVFVNCFPPGDTPAVTVLADEYQGGYDVAAAVFAAGHTNVAFLGGPADDYACQERKRGLERATADSGIPSTQISITFGTFQVGSGYDLAVEVLDDAATRPTAIICGNDRMAVGALMAAQALGMRCPEDISIVGFDDQPDLADQMHPPLTTVALPHQQMGFEAGTLLLAEAEQPGRHLVPCEYVSRSSLAAPRPEGT
ncbi:LacI family transcriptional regulator [Curtobacterium sp. PhB142]|uniref:LacI family DNA-binding transcriptional regulator n=1 Tax=unclassified Curtobacterium TaxID=257496 RepID=UPI001052D661|nr:MULTISPECIES: LacI family DNA-binding transcriptional regulator [unclassified Curtobacterium]TCL80493.1 LacI family transcriptional regulator [Curtobacterium sp. PhB142]TCL99733.1 LacI family transcriptional regulator [Curtobacterium sp. PhB134]TCU43898.1 LacI family transcriptional regulator [Curtobacterium sp. PhB146]TDW43204.1 LacI family transcriptional regulator [Curtobacterium sp. PhB42]TDW53499.1 LacI family transcriptional regulator [Curtobacterium sp. PhB190]